LICSVNNHLARAVAQRHVTTSTMVSISSHLNVVKLGSRTSYCFSS